MKVIVKTPVGLFISSELKGSDITLAKQHVIDVLEKSAWLSFKDEDGNTVHLPSDILQNSVIILAPGK